MEFSRRLLLIATFLLMARSVQPGTLQQANPKSPSVPAHSSTPAHAATNEKWVADTLAKMSLDEKLGQMLVVYYFGALTSTASPEYRELIRAVEQQHVGGFVIQTHPSPLGIERSQAYPTAALANQLQSLAKIPLIVAADFERGTAMRLDEGTSFPQAMAVGATGNPADAYTMGRITAIEARAAGVQWIFAPVSDVNSNPANPIINTRSFGEDPHRVAEFVEAFVRGVEENGGLACAKHFPGHGDTSTDSHLDLPTLTADRARLESVELVPFKAAIAAGVGSVMTGHLAVPSIEPDPNLPATLSPHITTDLLRKELGFRGVVVTDAMDMAGVAARYSPGEAAVRSIAAGTDVLLIPPSSDAALAALREAVDTGRISHARMDEAVTHILRAKAQLGLDQHRLVDLNALNKVFAQPEFDRAAADIANRGVTLLRDTQHLVPLDATKPSRVLLVAISGDADAYPAPDLEREIRSHADSLSVIRVDTRFEPAASIQLPKPDSYDVAIAALFVRVADRKGSVGLPDDQSALLGKLTQQRQASDRRKFRQSVSRGTISRRANLARRVQHGRCRAIRDGPRALRRNANWRPLAGEHSRRKSAAAHRRWNEIPGESDDISQRTRSARRATLRRIRTPTKSRSPITRFPAEFSRSASTIKFHFTRLVISPTNRILPRSPPQRFTIWLRSQSPSSPQLSPRKKWKLAD